MPRPLRIAIAGLGNVGAAVVKILQQNAQPISQRAGRAIEITAVSARNHARDRGIDISSYDWSDDPVALAQRDDTDLVVEVIGGENGPAKLVIEYALAHRKHVVSANKALLARHGQTLAELAEAQNVALRYEAAVCGGIPIIKALTEGLAANKITRVMGVMNGTCNYILTTMEKTGADYAHVLHDAQRLGYAEADPAFDVGGMDAAQKLALLAAAAFGTRIDYDGIAVEGIDHISLTDIVQARDMGFSIKLLGLARMTNEGLEQRMQPCLVPESSPLGQLDGVTNMVVVEGDFIGQTVYRGPGAGAGPTASAVVADIIDIARGLIIPTFGVPAVGLSQATRATSGVDAAYYLRFSLSDRPGALGLIATALGNHSISINRMRQYGHDSVIAPVLIVTHATARANLDAALKDIAKIDVSLAPPVALRIETV